MLDRKLCRQFLDVYPSQKLTRIPPRPIRIPQSTAARWSENSPPTNNPWEGQRGAQESGTWLQGLTTPVPHTPIAVLDGMYVMMKWLRVLPALLLCSSFRTHFWFHMPTAQFSLHSSPRPALHEPTLLYTFVEVHCRNGCCPVLTSSTHDRPGHSWGAVAPGVVTAKPITVPYPAGCPAGNFAPSGSVMCSRGMSLFADVYKPCFHELNF